MLNISKNSISSDFNDKKYKSLNIVKMQRRNGLLYKLSLGGLASLILIGFLPWTQNISSSGQVTALSPEQRPQTIHSIIPGRIESWMVQEGQLVNRGDTIALLSEIKEDYFDPNLIKNVESQIKAKELGVKSYMDKVNALDNQIDALIKNQVLKKEQARNKILQAQLKIVSDSIDFEAMKTDLKIAEDQVERMETLYAEGLKSLTDVEAKRLKYQESLAKKTSQENKLLTSRNELINSKVELNNIDNEFADKIAKSESDKYASMSAMYDTETQVTKLQNQYVNYSIRSGMYYIIAPQDGYITKAFVTGVGENIKEGEPLMSIMPANPELAVEMYVQPMDLPLLVKGQRVRLQFDGWPALVFSGWEGASFGTFGGVVVAMDNFTSENNKYRVLVSPDKEDIEWPKAIRVGAGAHAMTLLNNVPIAYELWRQINGFPPNFYDDAKSKEKNSKESK
ncbi:MAG: adhesin transport system membrane fusion protein [Chitinophagales bacterium]|jgi:multidrug resistance efflux pump